MSGKATVLGEQVSMEGAAWLHPELHPDVNPGMEPGLVALGDDVIAVKSPVHRPYGWEQQINGHDPLAVYRGDVVNVLPSVTAPEDQPPARSMLGLEFETNNYDKDGQPVDIYEVADDADDEELQAMLAEHPELLRYTLESSSVPAETTAEAMHNFFTELQRANAITARHNIGWDPMSAFAVKEPTEADFSPSPYVQSMWRFLGPQVRYFVNVGIHEHHDVPLQYLPFVTKYVPAIAPYLNVGLHAAPHVYGETEPDLGARFDAIEGVRTTPQPVSSARFLLMAAASPNGGVGKRNVYESFEDLLREADRQMVTDQNSNPSRIDGYHKLHRARFDDPSSRVELLFKDTGGFRVERLVAYAELSRRAITRLQSYAERGEEGLAALHREYPELFGASTDNDRYAAVQLERAHRNCANIAYDGISAAVESGTGQQVGTAQQTMNVFRFVTNNWQDMPSPAAVREFQQSLIVDIAHAPAVKQYRDEAGLPSFAGYLRTGLGTPSMWVHLRDQALRERGFTAQAIVEDGVRDRMTAFQDYVGRISLAR